MKILKKTMALAIALMLSLSLSVTAFAAGDTNSITINNAVNGAVYEAYRIFDMTCDSANDSYAYTVDADWVNFIMSDSISGTNGYVEVISVGPATDETLFVTWKKGTTEEEKNLAAAEFAELAIDYAKQNGIAADASATASEGAAVFQNLPLGYYLIDTSVGALCILDSNQVNLEVFEKNEAPTIVKQVKEQSIWGNQNDANIGDTVEFMVIIHVTKGAEGYVLHDTMTEGLTYKGVEGIKRIRAGSENEETVDSENYVVTAPGTEADGGKCTFEVKFQNAFLDTLTPGDQLVVYYSAEVNENAVIHGANTNEAILHYGQDSSLCSNSVTTTTYVWDMNLLKYTQQSDCEKIPLANAVFRLTTDALGDFPVNLVEEKANQIYRVCSKTDCAHKHVTQFTTDQTGKIQIKGLDSGTYYLHEIEAPDGYNRLTDPIKVTISNEGQVSVDQGAVADGVVEILNQTGSELPSTGGIGTTIFYAVGGILMSAAAVLLIVRKKMFAQGEQ